MGETKKGEEVVLLVSAVVRPEWVLVDKALSLCSLSDDRPIHNSNGIGCLRRKNDLGERSRVQGKKRVVNEKQVASACGLAATRFVTLFHIPSFAFLFIRRILHGRLAHFELISCTHVMSTNKKS